MTTRIEHVDRLAVRLSEAEAEAVKLAQAVTSAEGSWSQALVSGSGESKAEATMTAARHAHATATAKIPIMAQALQTARRAAMPERLELAEPEIERLNGAALESAHKMLEAVASVESEITALLALEIEYNALIADLRGHAQQAGMAGVTVDDDLRFKVSTRNCAALRIKLRDFKPANGLFRTQMEVSV